MRTHGARGQFLQCSHVLFFVMALACAGKLTAQTATVEILHSFLGPNEGGSPQAAVIEGSDGNFYGTTSAGGSVGDGTVFKITPAGVLTTLYAFSGGADGANPYAGLTQGSDGNFYGTTYYGANGSSDAGMDGDGTVFKITPAGVLTTLYDFSGGADGANPWGGLIQGSDGNFYGATYGGGNGNGIRGSGTVFKITPAGVLTTLYTFTGGADGANPLAGLTHGSDGNFYGTTQGGGAGEGYGTVFKISPSGVLTTLYAFSGGTDGGGGFPLALGNDGNFYGTTFGASDSDEYGTVFKITPAGVLTNLYAFTGGTDGRNPGAGLTQGSDGNFYGTTNYGGSSGVGTVFKITPAGVLTNLYTFAGKPDGAHPEADLTLGNDGNFYGTTVGGGQNGSGSVFRLTLSTTEAQPVVTSGTAGAQVGSAFSFQIVATNSPTSFGASGLPSGLNLDSTTGVILGTPTQSGTFSVNLYATNAVGTGTATLALTIAPAPVPIPVITSPSVLGGQAGQAFTYQIVASNSPTSYGASGLPNGLNVDSATGIISGVPSQSNSFAITLYATNAGGTGSQTLSLLIAPALPIVTLMATIPEVSAESGEFGEFTVSLSAPQTTDVHVSYTIQGSAINGTDYVTLSGTKKIKAGKTSKPIKITPQGDLGGASKKVVKLTLAPGQGYTVGTANPIKVKIVAGD